MCMFFEPFIFATYWEGAWSNFQVHSFMGSAPCDPSSIPKWAPVRPIRGPFGPNWGPTRAHMECCLESAQNKSLISDTLFAMKADHTRGLNIPTGGPGVDHYPEGYRRGLLH